MLSSLSEEVSSTKAKLNVQKNNLQNYRDKDVVREKLDMLFHKKVGEPFNKEMTEKICKEGKARFSKMKPPGYVDYREKIKGNDESDVINTFNQFGDLILWKQIIEMAKVEQVPVVFVTGDMKEDWFRIIKGQTIGPQPELLKEIEEEAGVLGYIYSVASFYEQAKRFLKKEVRQETVEEVESLTKSEVFKMYTNLQTFESGLDEELQYLIDFAHRNYNPRSRTIQLTFKEEDKNYQNQLIQKRLDLLNTAQKIFGYDIAIEVRKLLKDGTTTSVTKIFEEDLRPDLMTTLDESLPPDFWDEVEAVSEHKFQKGDRVYHGRFGEGTVIGISGHDFDQEATVIFKEAGAKRLLTNYANLKILD